MNKKQQIIEKIQELESNLSSIEKICYTASSVSALGQIFVELHKFLNELDQGKYKDLVSLSSNLTQNFMTRIVDVVSTLISNLEENKIPRFAVEVLMLDRRLLVAIANLSGYQGTNSLIKNLRLKNNSLENQEKINTAKTLLGEITFSSLDSIAEDTYEWILNGNSELATQACLSLLSDKIVLNARGEARRTALIRKNYNIKNLKFNEPNIGLVSRAWMYCTYAEFKGRHDLKEILNIWFRGYAQDLKLTEINVIASENKLKPKILVLAETLKTDHVMWRWYGGMIKELANTFSLELASLPEDSDDAVRINFSEFYSVSKIEDLNDIFLKSKPDIVFYPSVGMRPWTILLSNCRIANIQIAALGHPAPTRSKYIDHIIINQKFAHAVRRDFKEDIVVYNTNVFKHLISHTKLNIVINNNNIKNTDICNIAVIGKSFKMSNKLMAVLKKIEINSPKPIKFHFFPNEAGVIYEMISKLLKAAFKNSIVHKMTNYSKYLESIGNCNFAVSTFPFGQSSGIIDCISAGLPVLELRGEDLHMSYGADLLDMLGLSELVGDSESSIISMAIKLVSSYDDEMALRNKINKISINRMIGASNDHEMSGLFVNLLNNFIKRNNGMVR